MRYRRHHHSGSAAVDGLLVLASVVIAGFVFTELGITVMRIFFSEGQRITSIPLM